MDLKQHIKQRSSELLAEITQIRQHLHKNPELSFEEKETSRYIRSKLSEWGIHFEYPFAEHGILGVVEGLKPESRCIALRADMDALPIKEETQLPFASINEGVMHACGHDMHMAAMLGCAKIIQEIRNEIEGKVLLVFQPGEEKFPGGAKLMMEDGVFNKHQPELIIAQHVLPDMDSGTVGFKAGQYMASADEIYITVKGSGGHAALPEQIKDPILTASQILLTLQQEVNRQAPKNTPTVLSFGRFIADGAMNVIPNEVKLDGTFRTMNERWRKQVHQLIEQISNGVAEAMGTEVMLDIKHGYPSLINDEAICRKAKGYAIELLGQEQVKDMDIRMTAEDFAWFSQKYPAMLYRFGVKNPKSETSFSLHTPGFIADEKALLTAISTMSWIAVRMIQEK
jgi:amidohydrolase